MKKPVLQAASFLLAWAGSRQKALPGEVGETLHWQGGENETKSTKPLIFKQSMKDRQETYPGLDTNRLQRKGEGEKDMNVFLAIIKTKRNPTNQQPIHTQNRRCQHTHI